MLAACVLAATSAVARAAATGRTVVVTYPAPEGEPSAVGWRAQVDGKDVFLYSTRVVIGDRSHKNDRPETVKRAAVPFGYFDFRGDVTVTVGFDAPARGAVVRPLSRGVVPRVTGARAEFVLTRPGNYTLELDGDPERVVHIFANPLETDRPDPNDPNVTYFGPGVHEIGGTSLRGTGKTVYIAGGAIVRGIIGPNEKHYQTKSGGTKIYRPQFAIPDAERATIRGRGIIDMSRVHHHGRQTINIGNSSHVKLEGIIIVDSPVWTIPVGRSHDVEITNVKLIGNRGNSDGIDICNSRDVKVTDCFVRTFDDAVCVKTWGNSVPSERITVERCVVWLDAARAFGITGETGEDIKDITFRDCDVIRFLAPPTHHSGSLAVMVGDHGTVSDVLFEDIRLEKNLKPFFLAIQQDTWSKEKERGHIKGVTFRDIEIESGESLRTELRGFDAEHLVEDVTFANVYLDGKLVRRLDELRPFRSNEFVRNVTFTHEPPRDERSAERKAVATPVTRPQPPDPAEMGLPEQQMLAETIRAYVRERLAAGEPTRVRIRLPGGSSALYRVSSADERGIVASGGGVEVQRAWDVMNARELYDLCGPLVEDAPATVHAAQLCLGLYAKCWDEDAFERSLTALARKDAALAGVIDQARRPARTAPAAPPPPAAGGASAAPSKRAGAVVVHPAPEGEELSAEYTVEVEGEQVPVYRALTRYEEHGGHYSFCSFDIAGPVRVTVTTSRSPGALAVRSLEGDVRHAVRGNTVELLVERPGHVALEPNGWKRALYLFANPVETSRPSPRDPNVVYYGPGIHRPKDGLITLRGGQTLYLAGGAVVQGAVQTARGPQKNIRICGRGMLCGNSWPHLKGPRWNMLNLAEVDGLRVEGITIRGSWGWTLNPFRCANVEISNAKIVNGRAHNDDGMNICNCTDVRIDGCFIRTSDDCICTKGAHGDAGRPHPCERVTVENCLLQNDGSRGFLIGFESAAKHMRDITVRKCRFLHFNNMPFLVMAAHDMTLERVRLEDCDVNGVIAPGEKLAHAKGWFMWCMTVNKYPWNGLPEVPPGRVRDVVFRNIRCTMDARTKLDIRVEGSDPDHDVSGVRFENVTINERPLRQQDVKVGEYASDVKIGPAR